MKNVWNKVDGAIWNIVMGESYNANDKDTSMVFWNIRDNVSNNVWENVCKIIYTHIAETKPTSSQLQKAFDLL